MEREYAVAVNRGVDLDAFNDDMIASTGAGAIPNRSVDIADPRLGSKRITHYALTDEEAAALRNDPRVYAVEIPPDQRDDIVIGLNATQTGNFNKTTSDTGAFKNWGLLRCNNLTNVYGTSNTAPSTDYNYILDGTGVDVVIQDSGIQQGHPEWEDADGNSRLVLLDWGSYFPGFMNSNHYRDYHGHGTHCAGIAAGKTFGWAKGAAIYSQKLSGLEGTGDSGTGISISNAFDAIRGWHNAKKSSRPATIVNMSWGYSSLITDVDNGVYRGTAWNYNSDYGNDNAMWAATGVPPYGRARLGYYTLNARVSTVDAEIQEMIDDGIHVVIASGNAYTKIDVPTGDDYDNTVSNDGNTYYYHRGSSPYDDEAFIVGSIDSNDQSGADKTSTFTNRGPGVNIWAPGSNIMSASSQTNAIGGSTYNEDSSYKQTNISGTSMAAPQVCGVGALYLQINKNATPAQLKQMMLDDSQSVLHTTNSDTDYSSYTTSLMGAPNKMLYNKFNAAQDGTAKNGMIVRNTAIKLRK